MKNKIKNLSVFLSVFMEVFLISFSFIFFLSFDIQSTNAYTHYDCTWSFCPHDRCRKSGCTNWHCIDYNVGRCNGPVREVGIKQKYCGNTCGSCGSYWEGQWENCSDHPRKPECSTSCCTATNGGWSATSWGACDQTTGTQTGTRSCTNPSPSCGGADCSGSTTITQNCDVDGICGSAHGSSPTSAPENNLCSVGTATVVTGSGPWTWNCEGLNSGATASCTTVISGNNNTNGDRMHGYLWSDTIGWISLNCDNHNGCNESNYGVGMAENGEMSGTAWSDAIGWISFDYCRVDNHCLEPTYNNTTKKITGDAISLSALIDDGDGWDGRISLSDFDGSPSYGPIYDGTRFNGYSWGSTTVGWVLWYDDTVLDPFTFAFTADKGTTPADKAPYQSNVLLSWTTEGDVNSCTPTNGTTSWVNDDLPRGIGQPNSTFLISSIENDEYFTLTCTGPEGSIQRDLHIHVQPPAPTVILGVDDDNIPYNTATNLNWSTAHVANCSMSGPNFSNTAVSTGENQSISTGNLTNGTNSYTLTCTPSNTIAYPDDVIASTNVYVEKLVVDFGAESNPLTYNDSFKLIWDTEYANSCTASENTILSGSGGGLTTSFTGAAHAHDGEHSFTSVKQSDEGAKYQVSLHCDGGNGQFFDKTLNLRVGKNPLFMEN